MGDVRSNIKQHAIRLSVSERQTFRVCFAERLASRESVLCAGGLEVVCGSGLDVGYDAAAGSGGWGTIWGLVCGWGLE